MIHVSDKELYGTYFDNVLEYWEAFSEKPNVKFVFYEELKKVNTLAKNNLKINLINFETYTWISDGPRLPAETYGNLPLR